MIPMLDIQAQHKPLMRQLEQACSRVLQSGNFILGPEVAAFETETAAFLDAQEVVAVSSGTDALIMALMAAGIKPGDEVITTAFSFFATAECIARIGARPVFVDILPDTFNIDPEKVADAMTSATKAVVAVHLFGQPCQLNTLEPLCTSRKIALIEDAAQAFGAVNPNEKLVGSDSQLCCFSTFPSKNLGGFGDGGFIATNNAATAKILRKLRTHGANKKYHHDLVGGNFRMDALQAAMLRVKLPHVLQWVKQRRTKALHYDELFDAASIATRLLKSPRKKHSGHAYHQYVLKVAKRNDLRVFLTEKGIDSAVYYPTPLHLQPCFRYLGYQPGSLPNAEELCNEVLAIPIYPELQAEQQRYVVDNVARFFRTSTK